MSEPIFVISRSDGTRRDLRLTNARERVVIHNSLQHVFEKHSRTYPVRFSPPARERSRCLGELRDNFENLRTYRAYLRHHGQLPLSSLDEAIKRYKIWLNMEDDTSDEPEAVFFDADRTLGGAGSNPPVDNPPNTPQGLLAGELLRRRRKPPHIEMNASGRSVSAMGRPPPLENSRGQPQSRSGPSRSEPTRGLDAWFPAGGGPPGGPSASEHPGMSGRVDWPNRSALFSPNQSGPPPPWASAWGGGLAEAMGNAGAFPALRDPWSLPPPLIPSAMDTPRGSVRTDEDPLTGRGAQVPRRWGPRGAPAQEAADIPEPPETLKLGNLTLAGLKDIIASVVHGNGGQQHAERGGNRARPRTSLADISLADLRDIISDVVRSGEAPAPPEDRRNYQYDYTQRGRFHLLELEKFSGSLEEYPIFRQNLQLVLERERFRDSKDKALFVLRHLAGKPKESVAHLIRPLTEESFSAIIKKLDYTYGREFDLDRLLIRKIYKLPRVTDLTPDNLLDMITVLEGALPALKRRELESVYTTDGEKLSRVLGLIPQVDQDLFYVHCKITNQAPNLEAYIHYLNAKFGIRKCARSSQTQAERRQQRGKTPGKPLYLATGGYTDEDESLSNAGSENEERSLCTLKTDDAVGPSTKPKVFGPCAFCKGEHTLSYCGGFKGLTLEDKRKTIDQARACSSCLAVGHYSRDCKRRKKCTHAGCNMRHHPLLHDDYVLRVKFFEEVGGNYSDPAGQNPTKETTPPDQ